MMACFNCGKDVREAANSCPHCGAEFAAQFNWGAFFLRVVILLIVLWLVAGAWANYAAQNNY